MRQYFRMELVTILFELAQTKPSLMRKTSFAKKILLQTLLTAHYLAQ